MEITINGSPESLEQEITLSELLAAKGIDPNTVVVECNKVIINGSVYDSTVIKDRDQIEILRFVGGG